MKKLIISLASVTLTVGSSASVLAYAVNANNIKISELNAKQKEISLTLEQVAKSLSLNSSQNGGYQFDYLFNIVAKNQQIKWLNSSITLDESSNLTKNNRFYELYNKNFNSNLFSNDFVFENTDSKKTFSLKSGIAPQEAPLGSLVSTLSSLLPMVTQFIANKDILGMVSYLLQTFISVNPEIISEFSLLKFAKAILSDEKIESLSNAFDKDKYADFSVQEALNSSIIGLVNGLGKITNTKSEFENSTVQKTKDNFGAAMKELEVISSSLLTKITTLNFDLVESFDAIIEVVNFGRVLMVYLNGYINEVNSGSLKDADLQNKTISFDQLTTLRNKKFSDYSNSLDIKEFLKYMQTMLANDSGNGLKNLIALLFVEKPKEDYISSQLQISDTVSKFDVLGAVLGSEGIGSIVEPALDLVGSLKNFIASNSKTDYSQNYGLSSLFKATLNGIADVKSILSSLPEDFKQYLDVIDTLLGLSNAKIGTILTNILAMMSSDISIMSKNVKLFTDLHASWGLIEFAVGSLFPEYKEIITTLGKIIKFNFNEILAPTNADGKEQDSFKNLWSGKADFSGILELLGMNVVTGGKPFNLKSVFTLPITNIFSSGLLGLNSDKAISTMLDEIIESMGDKKLSINFDNAKGLVLNLKGIIDVGLNDPTKLMEKLGLNSDKTIKENSALDYLSKIFADLDGIGAIAEQLKAAADFFEKQQAQIKLDVQNKFKEISESKITIDVIDNYNYTYLIGVDKFEFTIKEEANKFVIWKIVIK